MKNHYYSIKSLPNSEKSQVSIISQKMTNKPYVGSSYKLHKQNFKEQKPIQIKSDIFVPKNTISSYTRTLKYFEKIESLDSVQNIGIQKSQPNSILCVINYKNKKNEVTLTQKYNQQILQNIIERLNVQEDEANRIIGLKTVNKDIGLDYILSLKAYLLPINQLKQRYHKKNIELVFVYRQQVQNKLLNLQLIKSIGNGGFSEVFLVRNKKTNQFFALKLILKSKIIEKHFQKIIKNEIQIHQSLQHSNICKMVDHFQSQYFYGLLLQYCSGGQLFNHLKIASPVKQQDAIFYFLEILQVIKYVHSQGIIYRDIKPQNILIRSNGNLALADFGLAKKIHQKQQNSNRIMSRQHESYSFCGSPQYMAPEMLQKKGHNQMLDYYCLGAFLYELVYGAPPFYSLDTQQIFQAVLNQEITFHPLIQVSEDFKDFIKKILNKNPFQRLGCNKGYNKMIQQHPLITNYVKKLQLRQKAELRPPYVPNVLQIIQNISNNILNQKDIERISVYLDLYKLQQQKSKKAKQKQLELETEQSTHNILIKIMEKEGKEIKETQQKYIILKNKKLLMNQQYKNNSKRQKLDQYKTANLNNRLYMMKYS